MKQFFHIALLMIAVLTLGFVASASAQGALTLPPSGDNQHSINTQYIGPVALTIDYHSPNVHAPDGTDRRGKIWGTLVPYGMVNLGFGTCQECPWRGGANENTTFTTSYDVTVQGKPLKAGTYGVHFIPGETEWTIIFSNNSSSWGSFTYDPKEDALRVTAKPEKSDYHEWLTYEFTDRDVSQATLALKWEDLQLPFQIVVPNIEEVYIDAMAKELRNAPGFDYRNWVAAAQYCLNTKKHLDLGLKWAEMAVSSPSYGTEAFDSLITLAQLQEANGQTAEAAKTKEKALNQRTAGPVEIHTYARGLQGQKKTQEAIEVFFLNAKKYPGQWPTEVGLARAYSAKGDYKEALKHAQIALSQNPPGGNKQNVENMIKKLQQGQDIN